MIPNLQSLLDAEKGKPRASGDDPHPAHYTQWPIE